MAFRLEANEGFPQGLRRIAREQFEGAIASLSVPSTRRAEGVHDARKHLKKLRALLALVENDFPAETYAFEDRTVRNAGRSLSMARDAEVMVATLDKLKSRFGAELERTAFGEIRRALARERLAAKRQLAAESAKVDDVVATLEVARDRVDTWPLSRGSFAVIRPGLKRAYARGRSRRSHVQEDPAADNFHAWRKRVKALWYHIRILESVWPGPLASLGDEVERLSEDLGDDHDLAVLRVLVYERRFSSTAAFIALLDQRRAELQLDAIHLGALVYAEGPRTFVERIERYWRASRGAREVDARDVSDWRARSTSADAGK